MRQIQDNEAVGLVGTSHGKSPGHQATPVMADDHCFVLLEVLQDGIDVLHQFIHAVTLHPFRLIALVVATLVDGHDLKVFGKGRHLVPPGVPEVWKAVNQDEQWSFTQGDVMNAHALGIDEAFFAWISRPGKRTHCNCEYESPPAFSAHRIFSFKQSALRRLNSWSTTNGRFGCQPLSAPTLFFSQSQRDS